MERRLPRVLLISIALAEGLALLALYKTIEFKVWPYGNGTAILVLFTLVITLPTMSMLSLWSDNIKYILKWLLSFGAILALISAYIGFQLEPDEYVNPGSMIFAFVVTIGIACFKALMYIQQRESSEHISYSALFTYSWRNFLILGLGSLFVLIFWGILMLWAGLFKLIGIDFFQDLFTDVWFIFPVLSLASGIAVIIFRNMTSVIDVIARLLQALIKYLLPLIILLAITFLAALLFSGLELLWETGSGSLMILWLLAITLFFINTVYQDKSDVRPYSIILHRFIYVGIALLPIYGFISAYGMYLRIDQYGWTVERCWGVFICTLLTLFSLGYVWGILKKRDHWISTLSSVNVSMGLVVLFSMLLVNSPLVDFRKISVNSQLARLESGEIKLEHLELSYFRRHLARPGYLALQNIKSEIKLSHPEIARQIDDSYQRRVFNRPDIDIETFRQSITTSPDNLDIPIALLEQLHGLIIKEKSYRAQSVNTGHYLISINMDDDEPQEYVWIHKRKYWGRAMLWHHGNEGWESINMQSTGNWEASKFNEWLASNNIDTTPHHWKKIKIGDFTFNVHERE